MDSKEKRNLLDKCTNCEYKDGFHISFKPLSDGKAELILICPSCHSKFRTGWIIYNTN